MHTRLPFPSRAGVETPSHRTDRGKSHGLQDCPVRSRGSDGHPEGRAGNGDFDVAPPAGLAGPLDRLLRRCERSDRSRRRQKELCRRGSTLLHESSKHSPALAEFRLRRRFASACRPRRNLSTAVGRPERICRKVGSGQWTHGSGFQRANPQSRTAFGSRNEYNLSSIG